MVTMALRSSGNVTLTTLTVTAPQRVSRTLSHVSRIISCLSFAACAADIGVLGACAAPGMATGIVIVGVVAMLAAAGAKSRMSAADTWRDAAGEGMTFAGERMGNAAGSSLFPTTQLAPPLLSDKASPDPP